MAPFNPEIRPTNDPNYGNNSRAIDTPDGIRPQGVQQNQIMPEGQKIGDRSAEFEGQAKAFEAQGEAVGNKAFGDLFSNIVGIADYLGKGGVQLVKKDIENKVYEIASNERSAYTAELEKIKANLGVKNIIADGPTDAAGDPVPEAISSDLPNTLATLRSARDGGKITKTDYQGRLAAEAQNLRSQYPGFKAEIDAEFSKVTGQNPANARVNGLITEINRAAAAAGSTQNKTVQYILRNDSHPDSMRILQEYNAGKLTDAQVYQQIAPYKQAKERLEVMGAVRRDGKETREEAQVQDKTRADYATGVAVAASVDKFATKYGFNTASSAEQLDQMQRGGQISNQQWAQRAAELQTEITRLEVNMMQDMKRLGIVKTLKGGQAEANEIIQSSLAPMHAMLKGITDKSSGQMFSAAREAQAVLDDNKKGLLTDSKAGPIWAGLKTMGDLGGEAYMQQWAAKEAFKKDGPADSYSEWSKRWAVEFMAQNGEKKNGKPTTFNDFVEEMKAKKIDDPIQQKRLMMDKINSVPQIGDTTTPDAIKINIAKAAFSAGNNGFLSKLNIDTFDERGRPVSGMNAVFQKWTAPEVSREMERLGRQDPAVWKQYSDWVKTTWATELVPRELADLGKFQKDPNIKISWDTENKRFEVSRTAVPELQAKYREGLGGEGKNTAEFVANQKQFETVSRSINRLNAGLYNMRHVAQMENPKDPTATDVFFLNAVAGATSPQVIQDINSLTGDMVRKVLLGTQRGNSK